MIKPLSFSEAVSIPKKEPDIPEFVIKVVNELLLKAIQETSIAAGNEIRILVSDFQRGVKEQLHGAPDAEILSHWYDFEELYRKEGWKVCHMRPVMHEDSYPPYYSFRKP